MKPRTILSLPILLLLLFAIAVPTPAQTAKLAGPSRQQAADVAARKQLAAYVADFHNHSEDAELRDKIIELAKTLKPAPVVPQVVRADSAKAVAQVKSASTAEDFKAAAKLFEQVAVQAPWYADAYYNAAGAYAKAKDYDSAKRNLTVYMAAARPGTDTQAAENLQHDIERQQGMQRFQQALEEFRKNPNDAAREQIIKLALKLDPKPALLAEVHEDVGRANYTIKNASSEADFIAAAETYVKVSQLAPWVSDYYFNQGVAYEKAKRFDQAIAAFGWYLVAEPNAKDADQVRERIGGLKYAKEQAKDKADATEKLVQAIHSVKPDAFRAAIEKGADVNAKDSNGWDALSIAIGVGTEDTVRYLIDRGANINNTWCCSSCGINACGGHTELMEAAYHLKPDLVQLFIRKGLPINARDSSGRSALAWAEGNECVVCIFCSAEDFQRETSRCRNNRAEVIRILKEAGAKE